MRSSIILVMKRGYIVYRKLETGEVLQIASRNTLREARVLAKSLEGHWPGTYLVRKSPDDTAEKKPSRLRAGDRMHATYAGASRN
jgi:hypothetical protein